MSALVGLFHPDRRPIDGHALGAMLAALAHRGDGDDATGTWLQGSAGLGQHTLRTTPESFAERLPFASGQAGLCITADARLDNRAELFALLDFGARPVEEVGDGELILAAYERWGEECPARLLGDFAFALWDAPRGHLFCARDHFGVKQLYYHASPKLFACATEIKALFALPDVPRRLNESRVADYLLSLFDDKSATLFKGVFALPPGCSLTVGGGGGGGGASPRLRPFWSPDGVPDLNLTSDAEYAECYLELFTEAVRCRLRSAAPVGSALSGGLDSSSITCVARRLLAEGGGQSLNTFSAVYDEVPECDERVYINSVLAQGGTVKPHYGHPDQLGPLTDWEKGAGSIPDEPLWNPQMALHWVLYEEARRAGVRVFLDGFGGDFVVSYGVTRLTELARSGNLLAAYTEARALARRASVPLLPLLRSRIALPLAPRPVKRAWRAWHRRAPALLAAGTVPLRADFALRTNAEERLRARSAARDELGLTVRQRHQADLGSGLYPFALGVDDRVTARFGLERRHPFLDRRLVEFCLALPAGQRMRNGWTRFVARRALRHLLPAEVHNRMSKADHSPSFNRGLLSTDRDILEDVVLNNQRRIYDYVDPQRCLEIYKRYQSRPDNEDGFILWRVATLALWLGRTGIEGLETTKG